MHDIKQIKLILTSLLKEKEKHLKELAILTETIENKKSIINKMQSYKNDYLNGHGYGVSKSIPVFYKNINLFVKKIDMVISQVENEINATMQMKDSLLKVIDKISRKIELMKIFEIKSKDKLNKKFEKEEQRMLDDVSSTILERSDYE